jgi:hypothetical protein
MHRHFFCVVVAVTLLLVVIGCAHEGRHTKPTTQPIAKTQAAAEPLAVADANVGNDVNAATRRLLARRLDRFVAVGEPVGDVVQKLRDRTELNIFVNWRALETQRVTKSLPVTLRLADVTAAETIDRLLATITGESIPPLGYTIDEGVVTISTREDLAKNTLTRVYDVRAAITDPIDRAADVARVIRRVQGLDPLSWRDAGGTVGSVRELSGQLIVTQTPQVHRRIVAELVDVLPAQAACFPILSTLAPRLAQQAR